VSNKKLHILVVDDDRSMAKTLVDVLRVTGYNAEAAYSPHEALEKAAQQHFDCLLTDVRMPGMNGVELYRAVRRIQPGLPVVLMTAYAANELVEAGLQEGVIGALTKPLDLNLLLHFFSSLRRERTIAIVDDDPDFCQTLAAILQVRGFAVIQVTNPDDAIEQIVVDVQVVLLDMRLNRVTGLDVLRQIRAQYPHLPVILVTAYRQEMSATIEAALEIEAYICLYKPLQIEELLRVLSELRHQELGRLLAA